MPTKLRLATFNLENLLSRARVLNLADKEQTSALLTDVTRLEKLLGAATYTAPVKAEILKLAKDLSRYVEIREDRGKLFSGTGSKRRVIASGRDSWDGAVEFLRAKISELARKSTADVVKALSADVLCAIEVEDRGTLAAFNSQLLGTKKFRYSMVIDGNDPRGIDVGVLSKFEIVRIVTHIFDRHASGYVFSRDCLEIELRLPDGRPLFFLCNHFKSQGYGDTASSNAKRLRQARRVVEILGKFDLAKDLVVVAGDLNDKPGSAPLAPLLAVPNLFDVLALQFPDAADRWTYQYGSQLNQLDYLLVSKPLKTGFKTAAVERRGIHGIEKLAGVKPFASVTSASTAASDHGAVAAEFVV